jgi:hypothetical protein
MPFDPITAEQFLAVFRAVNPSSYARALEEAGDGQGFDTVAGAAALFERLSAALVASVGAYYLLPHSTQTAPPAGGAARATTTATIRRLPASAPYALDLAAGYPIATRYRGPRGDVVGPAFRLAEEVTLGAADLEVGVAIEAVRPGFAGNVRASQFVGFAELGRLDVPGASISGNTIATTGAFDRVTRAQAGRLVSFPAGTPNALEGPRRIVAVTDLGGGAASVIVSGAPLVTATQDVEILELADLGIELVVEDDATGGRAAVLDAIGAERNVPRRLGESDTAYRDRVSTLADTVSPAAMLRIAERILSPLGIGFRLRETRDLDSWPGFVLDVDALDYGGPFEGYVDLCDAATSFVIEVGLSGAGEFGAAYDAGDENALDWLALDGFAVTYSAALGALWSELDAARAAGVCFDVVLDPSL